MSTVLTATIELVGAGAGSLHVVTVSPARAAGLLLISTVALPLVTVPWLVGGIWKGPPCGMCGGTLVAVLPTTAAGWPPMNTSVLHPPVIVPAKGWGSGVGTGPPGLGIITMWVSVPTTLSPILAAGLTGCSRCHRGGPRRSRRPEPG